MNTFMIRKTLISSDLKVSKVGAHMWTSTAVISSKIENCRTREDKRKKKISSQNSEFANGKSKCGFLIPSDIRKSQIVPKSFSSSHKRYIYVYKCECTINDWNYNEDVRTKGALLVFWSGWVWAWGQSVLGVRLETQQSRKLCDVFRASLWWETSWVLIFHS